MSSLSKPREEYRDVSEVNTHASTHTLSCVDTSTGHADGPKMLSASLGELKRQQLVNRRAPQARQVLVEGIGPLWGTLTVVPIGTGFDAT